VSGNSRTPILDKVVSIRTSNGSTDEAVAETKGGRPVSVGFGESGDFLQTNLLTVC
jgi:hypothetical protein